ncbi:hypothetical protein BAUCODRAFT_264299 [Baudoinia panamericana UAMH 10762]|uniref:Acetoacetate decarboxylase n=1 Tax=Baudoinia panamericana (strain UAMH 10762) TaxID=717646 RepID=M2LFN4_BAUPA|nr:uncharacterized protein BAUCODRAFT_264299 [Baudoinia panamericana UAMH 10762]EMC92857.1 hypothetical protein BAUCODRAFT_264299 [Baudoinia panamericana UAMH 10762]
MGSDLPLEASAPWKCRAESYWMILQLQNPLPVDIYDQLEAEHPACTTAGFKGGYGMVMVVRYSDTPVGSYDELAIIPGNFNVKGGSLDGQAKLRVTRIYVSQKDTTYNGRRNWNIPKHLARFEFSAPPVAKGSSPPKQLTVSVYPPDSEDANAKPFFRATFAPISYLPAFPLSTSYMPLDMTIVQPPIPAGEDSILCGTDKWVRFQTTFATSRAYLMRATNEDDYGKVKQEGWWPRVKPWSTGFWLEEAVLDVSTLEEEWS